MQRESTHALLAGTRTLAIVCTQWGDTGKGKFVDFFADWADIIARGTGGANAGHTIVLNGVEHIFHLVPSGILYDGDGKLNIIGNGTVIDPHVILQELGLLRAAGLPYNHLLISLNAKLILPQHIVLDRVRERVWDKSIGTTGRGIGPAYEDYYGRTALVMNDLLNVDVFVAKLRRNLRDKVAFLAAVDPAIVHEIMQHEHLGNGRYWSASTMFSEEAIVDAYRHAGQELHDHLADTDSLLQRSAGKRNILLEGAQGHLLSVHYGSYPFVTSSDCSVRGLAQGVGLSERAVDRVWGIVKAFFMTRVGNGPFPTEFGGEESAAWCATKGVTRTSERERFGEVSVNDPNPFLQGVGVRMAAGEYGATTGRPRRTGWLDLPLLRYAVRTGCTDGLILTKLDSLDACDTIKLCTRYRYDGPDCWLGNQLLTNDGILDVAIPEASILQHCTPVYQEFPGWCTPIGDIRKRSNLPRALTQLVEYVEQDIGKPAVILSVGRDREQTIVC